jgi:hypothetical protein
MLERERERRGMRVKDLERKKRECGEREGKKERERERETYERIQGMRKKMLRIIITSKLNF